MEITQSSRPHLRMLRTSQQQIRINDQLYQLPLLIENHQIQTTNTSDWREKPLSLMQSLQSRILIVASNMDHWQWHQILKQPLEIHGYGVEIMGFDEALRTSIIMNEEQRTFALLLLE